MFYGPSYEENYRRAAALADKILRGARPSELPVENPTKFELVIVAEPLVPWTSPPLFDKWGGRFRCLPLRSDGRITEPRRKCW
jgi:hypothetical protein